ncbi:MAG TPA: DPP IV N-terminal domain-containing protein [Bacteroidales bacterium]|jgi:dipeptidyl aminopeptidase/acylaminoacyl peptidase|nr:DPP IV N-terminal domain-containing protein [Bacteroidales bacterium]HQH23493.1 DPP IV N-terminal domain-containing protein [Bacteroidales bacterium]HQJ82069.1 DPP IV N-terminal domain-containing protein [Bacteroidales bacterium]
MRYIKIVLFVALSVNTAFSQKADFRAAEKFRGDNIASRYGDLSVNPVWLENSDIFWYSFKTSSGRNFYYVNAAAKSKKPLFDSRYMASELKKLTSRPYNDLDLPITELKFEKKSLSRFTFRVDSIRFLYDMATRKLVIRDTVGKEKKPSWPNYSPDSTWFAYARNYNLYLMKTNDRDSVEIQLTTDGERYYGYSSYRSGQDTVRDKKVRANVRWFKNEKKLFIIREDVRKVKDLFVINSLAQPRPSLESYRYSMPGEEFVPQQELIIFDVETRGRINVDLKKWKDQTINVAWSSQEESNRLIVIRKDRTLKNLDVCMVDAETGDVKVLFSEKTWPYFNNEYSQLAVLNEGSDIIWWSERSGWGQLYLYDIHGNIKKQITDGYFVTGRINRIDTLGRVLYLEAFGKEDGVHPYYNMKYKVSLDKGGMTLITGEPANHSMSMSKSCRYFVDTFSTVDMVPESVLRDNNGNTLLRLEKADLSQLFQMGWKMPETIKVKAKDGVTDLYGVMYKPFNFDSTRKYPVISYVYPGPQTESVPYEFTVTGGKNVALAQLGFIVVNYGHRGGSPQRSNYYHTFGYDNLRDYALADDKYGIEQLAEKYKFIDIGKVGIYGHSGGGFMSTAAILSYPDFYQVAVSSAGNHDNNIYNQWWGETHDGVKEVEKKSKGGEGVKKDSLDSVKEKETTGNSGSKGTVDNSQQDGKAFKSSIDRNQDLAKNLKGHLLLVHGDIDNNVHPGNTLRVADALIKANKRFDFMILPGQRHAFGNATAYFDRLMWYYFAEHLLGDYRTNVDLTDF